MHLKTGCLIFFSCAFLSWAAITAGAENQGILSFDTDGPRPSLSLDGSWDLAPIKELGFTFPPAKEAEWVSVSVPMDDCPGKANRYWCRKRFVVSPKDEALVKGKKIRLIFKGVGIQSKIWLNGQCLGENVQCWTPFEFDVTGIVQFGKENELIVGFSNKLGTLSPPDEAAHMEKYKTTENAVSVQAWNEIRSKTKMFVGYQNWSGNSGDGIYDQVGLELASPTWVEDVFIKTSVSNKNLGLDIVLQNDGKTAATVSIAGKVISVWGGKTVLKIKDQVVTVAAAASKRVTIEEPWENPTLWDTDNPFLYYLDLDLLSDGQIVDRQRTRFGFREISIKGKDILLNGKRIWLRRTTIRSAWTPATARGKFRQACYDYKKQGVNCIRLWTPYCEETLNVLDEMGMMCDPSGAWMGRIEESAGQDMEKNTYEYYRRWFKYLRNHPALIIWNGSNEVIWGGWLENPRGVAIMEKVIDIQKEMDPTRPIMFDAEVDVKGKAPIANLHYPRSKLQDRIPDGAYWLTNEPNPHLIFRYFPWVYDRPVAIGEWWYDFGLFKYKTAFAGDSIYDPYVWPEGETFNSPYHKEAIRIIADGLRYGNAALVDGIMNADYQKQFEEMAVRSLDYNRTCYSGESLEHRVVVYNDSLQKKSLRLTWFLLLGPQIFAGGAKEFDLEAGGRIETKIPITFPKVKQREECRLMIYMNPHYGKNIGAPMYEDTKVFAVFPKSDFASFPVKDFLLFDSKGTTGEKFAQLGFACPVMKQWNPAQVMSAKVLIIGKDSAADVKDQDIIQYVSGGGRVICLEQEDFKSWMPEIPEIDIDRRPEKTFEVFPTMFRENYEIRRDHIASQAWIRSPSHPVVKELKDSDLKCWRPDNRVSFRTHFKPTTGNFRTILDAGGIDGLAWSPLFEVFKGKGSLLITQMPLVKGSGIEPVADVLLHNLLAYALENPPERSTLGVYKGTTADIPRVLNKMKIDFEEGFKPGQAAVLICGGAKLDDETTVKLKDFVRQGGYVILHALTPEDISMAKSLLPITINLKPSAVKAVAIRYRDPLLDSVSNEELFWAEGNYPERWDRFGSLIKTTDIVRFVLDEKTSGNLDILTEPAAMAKIPFGKGTFIIDQVLWQEGYGVEFEKCARLINALLTNVGVRVKPALHEDKKETYVQVGLADYANHPLDGDLIQLRYFPVDISGKNEQGVAAPIPDFPPITYLAGVPFKIIDPRGNNGRSILVLRAQVKEVAKAREMPKSIPGIKVNERADKMYFVHTCAWSQQGRIKSGAEAFSYLIHYEDGSTVKIPAIYQQNVDDWWRAQRLGGAKIAWKGACPLYSPVALYFIEWENPYPKKLITSLDFVGEDNPGIPVLIAVSISRTD